jgi:Tol biopolymer transport system component
MENSSSTSIQRPTRISAPTSGATLAVELSSTLPPPLPTSKATLSPISVTAPPLVATAMISPMWQGPLLVLYPEDLLILDFATNQSHRLLAKSNVDAALGWSSDGCQLAYNLNGSMYTINIFTREIHQVLAKEDVPDTEVKWSPSGELIAYTARSPGEIFVTRRDGKEIIQLTEDGYEDQVENWSPDGQSILYWSKREKGWALFSAHLATRVTTEVIVLPSMEFIADLRSLANLRSEILPGPLSPDQRLAVVRPYYENQQGWFSQPYLLNISTGHISRLYDRWAQIEGIAWSPDGTQIAIGVNEGADGPSGIYLIDVTKGDYKALAANAAVHDILNYPSWSGDGTKLAFLGSPSPWSYDFQIGEMRKLLPEADLSTPVQWYSPMLWSPKSAYKPGDCR